MPTAETFALPYLEMGVTTYSSAIFNFLPQFAQEFYAAVRRRDHDGVSRELREFVLPYIDIRNRRKGYAVSIVKAGMSAIGRPAGPVRTPLIDLDQTELDELTRLIAGRRNLTGTGDDASRRQTHVRYLIVLMLFVASCFSYGDRVALSIAGTAYAEGAALDPVKLGFLLSGFSWAYVLGQLPAGGLLDRFGSKRVYGTSIVCWTTCAFLVGFAGYLPALAFSARSSVCACSPGLRSRRFFRGMDVSSRAGFPRRNAGSVGDFQCVAVFCAGCVRSDSSDGLRMPMAGEAASGSWESLGFCLPSPGGRWSIT